GRLGGGQEGPVGRRRERHRGRRRIDGEGAFDARAHVARRVALGGLRRVGAVAQVRRRVGPRAAAARHVFEGRHFAARRGAFIDRHRHREVIPLGFPCGSRERGRGVFGRRAERVQRDRGGGGVDGEGDGGAGGAVPRAVARCGV